MFFQEDYNSEIPSAALITVLQIRIFYTTWGRNLYPHCI